MTLTSYLDPMVRMLFSSKVLQEGGCCIRITGI